MTTFDVRECTTKSDIMFRDSYCRQVIHATMAGVESGHTFYAVGGEQPVEVVSVQASTTGDDEGQYIIRCRSAGGDAPQNVMTISPTVIQITSVRVACSGGLSFGDSTSLLNVYEEKTSVDKTIYLNTVDTGHTLPVRCTRVGPVVSLEIGPATCFVSPSTTFVIKVPGATPDGWNPASTLYGVSVVNGAMASGSLASDGTFTCHASLNFDVFSSVTTSLQLGLFTFQFQV